MTLLALPERSPGRTIAAIGVLFALAYGASIVVFPKPGGRLLIGDALHHYVQLRSVVFDRDLQFQNEYVRMYGLRGGEPGTEWVYEPTATGHTRNLMPIGPGILWAPAFLGLTLGVWLATLIGVGYPLDGYGTLFQAAAGFSGIAAACGGVWLSYRASGELFAARSAIWSALVLWLASSAVYYSVISPTYSHAASLFATSAFWYAFVRTRATPSLSRYAILGALAGVAALMRWQDALLVVIVGLDLAWSWYDGVPLPRLASWAAASAVAAIVAFSPQMIVWQTLYGQPLSIPQGGDFMRWTEPALLPILFSTARGLFTWTPIVAIACVGFVPLARRDARVGVAAIVFLAMSWYVNAAVADWWAGEAFGARRFVSCFPVLALGLTAFTDRLALTLRTLAAASAVVVLHLFLLLVQYQAYMKGVRQVVPYPSEGAYELWLARFVVPFELVRWWLTR